MKTLHALNEVAPIEADEKVASGGGGGGGGKGGPMLMGTNAAKPKRSQDTGERYWTPRRIDNICKWVFPLGFVVGTILIFGSARGRNAKALQSLR